MVPTACRLQGKDPGMWGLRRYQYWDAVARNWTERQPAACVVPGLDPAQHKWRWRNGSPRSAADCNDNYCLYENLWCAAARCLVWGLGLGCQLLAGTDCQPCDCAGVLPPCAALAACTPAAHGGPCTCLACCRFNNGRFYLLVDGEEGIVSTGQQRGAAAASLECPQGLIVWLPCCACDAAPLPHHACLRCPRSWAQLQALLQQHMPPHTSLPLTLMRRSPGS